MEPEISLPYSQEAAACPNPEPGLIHFDIIRPCVPRSFKWSSLRSAYQNCACISLLPHTCHVHSLAYSKGIVQVEGPA